jgi:hypothetical protein
VLREARAVPVLLDQRVFTLTPNTLHHVGHAFGLSQPHFDVAIAPAAQVGASRVSGYALMSKIRVDKPNGLDKV